jgi:hypothetical protein
MSGEEEHLSREELVDREHQARLREHEEWQKRRTVAEREDYRLCKGSLCGSDHTHGRRAPRAAIVEPSRGVAGCLYGGGWRGVGVDGVLHAQWATCRRGFKIKAIAHAADSLCRQPRDHYRSHYALRCAHPDDIATHLVNGYRGGYRDYLAGDVAGRALRGQTSELQDCLLISYQSDSGPTSRRAKSDFLSVQNRPFR